MHAKGLHCHAVSGCSTGRENGKLRRGFERNASPVPRTRDRPRKSDGTVRCHRLACMLGTECVLKINKMTQPAGGTSPHGKDGGTGLSTTANLGATTPRLRAGWTGMLDGTSRPKCYKNPEFPSTSRTTLHGTSIPYGGVYSQEGRGGAASPAVMNGTRSRYLAPRLAF